MTENESVAERLEDIEPYDEILLEDYDALQIAIQALREKDARDNPLVFIDALRNSDGYIKTIYMDGGCYSFYLVLKSMYPTAHPYMLDMGGGVPGCDHVITQIGDKYYDICGEFDVSKYELYEVDEKAKGWSFWENNGLFTECPNCEEPVMFNPKAKPLHTDKPLTLAQLKERVGKPVWIRYNGTVVYCKVLVLYLDSLNPESQRFIFTDNEQLFVCSYGKTWLAYDHQPKGEK